MQPHNAVVINLAKMMTRNYRLIKGFAVPRESKTCEGTFLIDTFQIININQECQLNSTLPIEDSVKDLNLTEHIMYNK